MITAYISAFNPDDYIGYFFLVIGVKNADSDLDTFLENYPDLRLIQRMPEVCNIHYLNEDDEHMLQAALIHSPLM